MHGALGLILGTAKKKFNNWKYIPNKSDKDGVDNDRMWDIQYNPSIHPCPVTS